MRILLARTNTPTNLLPAWRQLEVVLTILKLTETGRQAQVSIGMHAHPKMCGE